VNAKLNASADAPTVLSIRMLQGFLSLVRRIVYSSEATQRTMGDNLKEALLP
jgi:hypothetical protein